MTQPVEPVFANSAWVPGPECALLKGGRWRGLKLRVRYGLFLHPDAGPVLIDTGYTPEALTAPGRSLGLRVYSRLLRARLIPGGQPEALLARFNLRPTDVRHVVVTHFHADHVSGLRQFQNARFIASGAAFERMQARSPRANMRHGVFPELFPADFADRLVAVETRLAAPGPMNAAPGHDLFGDGTVIGVDLPGHADGHFGLYFPQAHRPLLYGVDAQWLLAALAPGRAPRFLPRMIAEDPQALAPSSALLHAFGQGGDVVLCHDPAPTLYDLDSAAGPAP